MTFSSIPPMQSNDSINKPDANNDKSNVSNTLEIKDLSGLCARDRLFAQTTAYLWDHDLPWDSDMTTNTPDYYSQSPINDALTPFRRHYRERMDDSRRSVSIDWVAHGYKHLMP